MGSLIMPFGIVSRTNGVPMPHHFPLQGLSFRDKKSLATAFAHSLGPMAFMGSPHDLGMQITDRVLSNPDRSCNLAAKLKDARCPFQQRARHCS